MDMKEFENDLLSENATEKYLNMSREELEKIFGSEFVKIFKFNLKIYFFFLLDMLYYFWF